jgi:hypothetical protein
MNFEEKEILKFIRKDIKDATALPATLKKLTSVLKKNQLKITDDYMIVQLGMMLYATFVDFSKVLNLTEKYNFNKEAKIYNNACDKVDDIILKNADFLQITSDVAKHLHDNFEAIFSTSNGYANWQIFSNSIKNIGKTNMEFKTLEKKWDKLILF